MEYSHATGFVIQLLGFCALVISVLADTRRGTWGTFMYHMIVKRRLTSVFQRLGKGDYEYALSDVGTTIDHHFSGDHCLGGKLTSARAMRQWFERLFRLFPNLRFDIQFN